MPSRLKSTRKSIPAGKLSIRRADRTRSSMKLRRSGAHNTKSLQLERSTEFRRSQRKVASTLADEKPGPQAQQKTDPPKFSRRAVVIRDHIHNRNQIKPDKRRCPQIKPSSNHRRALTCSLRTLNRRVRYSEERRGEERSFTVLTWEFPVLAKFKLPVLKTRPFVEFGPSFRASGNLNDARPSRQGITEGIGMELHKRGPAITPTLRFTHWAADPTPNAKATHPNQIDLVVGLRF